MFWRHLIPVSEVWGKLLDIPEIAQWLKSSFFLCSGSTLCFLHLLIPSRPLILSGNDTIILGPYHTFYGKLDEHMQRVGLSTQPNMWDQPLCVGTYWERCLFPFDICKK